MNPNEESRDPIDRYSAFIIRGVILSAGVAGVALIMRNSRLFARFTNVNQIPHDFVQRQMELKGCVKAVLPNGILQVQHDPIINLPWRWPRQRLTDGVPTLQLRLAGLDISKAGQEYLVKDVRLLGHPVTFSVIKRTEDANTADAEVTVRNNYLSRTNLNIDLVRRGLARVTPPEDSQHLHASQTVPAYSRLINRLLTCEKVAERRGIGLWERETWVESLRALPSQIREILLNATITRFAVLLWNIGRDFVAGLIIAGRSIYEATMITLSYLALFYRRFGIFVNRAATLYGNTKQKLNR